MDLVMMRGKNAVCDSLDVAEHFGKRHQEILYAIEGRKCSCGGDGCEKCSGRGYQQLGILRDDLEISTKSHLSKMFKKSSYKDDGGRNRPKYYMNRDGFSLLVMGFTGKEAVAWKMKYIEAFNRMEQLLAQKQTKFYEDTREYQKAVRKQETDTIKALVDYAAGQGSRNAARYYSIFSRLADKTAGIKDREQATIEQLGVLALIETIISRCISDGIRLQKPYRDIYRECRQRLEQFCTVAFIESK